MNKHSYNFRGQEVHSSIVESAFGPDRRPAAPTRHRIDNAAVFVRRAGDTTFWSNRWKARRLAISNLWSMLPTRKGTGARGFISAWEDDCDADDQGAMPHVPHDRGMGETCPDCPTECMERLHEVISSQYFVAYHNVDQRGTLLGRGRSGRFETNKAGLPRKGDVLWCFEGKGRPKEYRLVKRAVISRSDKRVGRPSQVRYQAADPLDAVVNDAPWFKKLFAEQGRFGFGVNPVLVTGTVDELESFAAGLRADAVEEDVSSAIGTLPPTIRKALIEARLGQGAFRRKLGNHWSHAWGSGRPPPGSMAYGSFARRSFPMRPVH